MSEVSAARGSSGLRFVSTFSGCGGACLGLEMAGFQPLWASEFVEAARDVYALNHPGVPVDDRDIRQVTADDIMHATGLVPGELDLFEGSPPCKSFTPAAHTGDNAREKGWGKERHYSDEHEQQTDDLFFEYVRLLRGLRPRAFIAENVPGLVQGMARGYFKEILQALTDCGYRTRALMLDAQWLGVPQARKRLIFFGLRDDVPGELPDIRPLPYRRGVREACADLVDGEIIAWVRTDRRRRLSDDSIPLLYFDPETPSCTIVAQVNRSFSNPSFYDCGLLVRPPGCTEDLSIRPEWIHGVEPQKESKYFATYKPRAPGGVEPEPYTDEQLKRVCSFPDDFELAGAPKQRWERLGRAVPPLMYRAVGEAVRRTLEAAR